MILEFLDICPAKQDKDTKQVQLVQWLNDNLKGHFTPK